MIAVYILLAIVILLFMILVHELGHYIVGKILKFKINEFSIGFGFPIFSKTNKKTGEKFSLRIFPLGGYCAFDGEDDDNDGNKSPTAFNNQKPWKRILVLLGGVTMNFITAIIFSWVLLSSIGYDVPQIKSFNNTTYSYVQTVEEEENKQFVVENPYSQGDVITHINGKKIDFAFGGNYVSLVNAQRANARAKYDAILKTLCDEFLAKEENAGLETVSVDEQNKMLAEFMEAEKVKFDNGEENQLYTFNMSVRHNSLHGKKETLNIVVCPVVEEYTEKDKDGVDVVKQRLNVYVGLESAEGEAPCTKAYVYNAWEGFCRSFEMAFGFAWVVLKSLWMLITFQIPISQMTGTVGTITTIATMASQSLSYLLIFIPLIAANLAIFNLLPIPSLDGAHVMFTTIEWIRGKPINRKVENMIHFVGLCVMLGFVVIIDILHFVL